MAIIYGVNSHCREKSLQYWSQNVCMETGVQAHDAKNGLAKVSRYENFGSKHWYLIRVDSL